MRKYFIVTMLLVAPFAMVMGGCNNETQTQLGDPFFDLTPEELTLFEQGLMEFSRIRTAETGLGPIFNAQSCASCHSDPIVGGVDNVRAIVETQIGREIDGVFDALADLGGGLLQNRGIGELIDGCPTGEFIPVEATFTSTRQTPPVFGDGLIEAIPDGVILALEDPDDIDGDGISGRANITLTGALGRFGWKANVPDLLTFSSGALLLEIGITNPFDPPSTLTEQLAGGNPIPEGCDLVEEPESGIEVVEAIAAFQRFLAPPPRGEITGGAFRGESVFNEIGCAGCHVPSLPTGDNEFEVLSNKDVKLFSDLLLHDMGEELADGIVQEIATGDEFRTAPLWGLGVRTFFLHDGRTASLVEAIILHGGEAEGARDGFLSLSQNEAADLLAFLNSL